MNLDREELREGSIRPLPTVVGFLLFALTLVTPPPSGFSPAAWPVLGLTAWMACWWALEAVPLAVTALLPLLVVPPMWAAFGIANPAAVLGEYANASVFLILGGLLLAIAMERCNLHKRVAYNIVIRLGDHPRQLILGVMIASAFISMWVSNTSTTLMMLPVATSIAMLIVPSGGAADQSVRNFRAALTLSVAYAATIGGMGTLIGSPTNALVQGFAAKNFGIDLSFVDWLLFGLPTVVILLPLTWFILVRVALPFELPSITGSRNVVRTALDDLGPMSVAERRVAAIVMVTAVCWITRPLLNLLPGLQGINDTVIAIAAGLVLYLTPSGRRPGEALLDAGSMGRIPWDVLLLFGGGLALAAAIQTSALSDTLGLGLAVLGDWPLWALTLAIVCVLVLWTELNSNVAAAATFMPILAALSGATGQAPLSLIVPAAMAASAGFMMPVGTPGNAIAFATGEITMRQMLRAGALIDLAAAVVIACVAYYTVPLIGSHR